MAQETDIRQALVTYLSGLQGLADLVGDRISPLRHRMGVDYPRVRYQVVSHQRVRSASGPCGQGQARLQLDCLARSYEEAYQVARLVVGTKAEPRMDGYTGAWGDYHIDEARVDDWADDWDEPIEGDEEGVYRHRLDVLVTYTEPGA